jgi:Na+-driven multidrug efflux pump
VRIMTSDPEVYPLAVELIHIAGVFQVFDGIQAVSSGARRGSDSVGDGCQHRGILDRRFSR